MSTGSLGKDLAFEVSRRFYQKKFHWVEFVSPSTLHLTPFLKILLEPIKSEERLSRIELGLHEALVNAVQHGNRGDLSRQIRVRRILTPNWFVWQIQDEGKGMPSQSRTNTLPSDIEAENGRGLFLIHQCFDDVRWSNKGNRLQLASRRKLKS